ncbi:MAG: hypothetical protein QN122_12500 [Armatimonadota bacterium]|nr:hypothetical protein [Armatimonadota bacterium]
MGRMVALDDGRAALLVKEWTDGRRFDGRNRVSRYSGQEFRGAHLGRSAAGRWILLPWSSWQGERPLAREISAEEAAGWFARQGLFLPQELEEAVV